MVKGACPSYDERSDGDKRTEREIRGPNGLRRSNRTGLLTSCSDAVGLPVERAVRLRFCHHRPARFTSLYVTAR